MRVLLRSGLNTSQATEKMRENWPDDPDIAGLIDFIESSEYGVIKVLPGGGRQRGGTSD